MPRYHRGRGDLEDVVRVGNEHLHVERDPLPYLVVKGIECYLRARAEIFESISFHPVKS